MDLAFGGPIYTQRNPSDMPSIYASDAEWAAYRAKQKLAREFAGTNQSGMTPQGMEQAAVDPIKNALAMLMSGANAATIGKFSGDPTYSEKAVQNSGGDVTSSKETPEKKTPTAEQTIMELAFPEVFRKQPPTGVANTEGGVERVNARTAEHGTRAIRDAKGNITLTNINPDGSVNKGTGSANSVNGDGRGNTGVFAAPNISANLSSSVDLLRKAKTAEEAQGILININQTIAQQSSALNDEATRFGANKVGLPALEQELQQAIQADRNDPKWVPGIGDSPITQDIRRQIAQAEALASNVAKTYISSNPKMAALRAMEENSKLVYETIKRNSEFTQRQAEYETQRRNSKLDTAELQAGEFDRRQAERTREKVELEIGPLDSVKLTRMAILDPSVKDVNGTVDPLKAQKSAYSIKQRNPKEYQEAIDLPDNELPGAALAGNEYAMTLAIANELKNNPSATEQMVREKMALVRQNALSPTFEAAAEAFKLKGFKGADLEAAKREIQQTRIAGRLGRQDASVTRMKGIENFNIALRMEQAAATKKAIADAGSIIDPNGPLGAAMMEAQKLTGKRNLADVWTAYRAANTAVHPLIAAKQFNDEIEASINKAPFSMFGKPNGSLMREFLIAEQRSVLREILSAGRKFAHFPVAPFFPPLAIDLIEEQAQQQVNNY